MCVHMYIDILQHRGRQWLNGLARFTLPVLSIHPKPLPHPLIIVQSEGWAAFYSRTTTFLLPRAATGARILLTAHTYVHTYIRTYTWVSVSLWYMHGVQASIALVAMCTRVHASTT